MPQPVRTARALLLSALCWTGSAFAFELLDESGERARLTDRVGDGRWALVLLWTVDCIPCERQKPMLDAFHAEHVDDDAQVIGVALDGPAMTAQIERVKARTPVGFPTLVALDDVFRGQFETLAGQPFRATPTYLMFDPDGTLLGVHVGSVTRDALERLVEGG